MAFTVTSVINDIVARYRDLDRTSALAYLQAVHTDILTECRILADVEDINLVAGTRVYALTTTVLKIWEAELYKSSTDSLPLELVSSRNLDRYEPRWRTIGGGRPTKIYQEHTTAGARQIGLYLTPDATSATAYPTLRLQVSRNQTLGEAVNTTSFPESIFDSEVYRSGVWLRHARSRHGSDIREHLETFLAEKAKVKAREVNLLADVYPRNDPPFRQTSRPY